MSFAIPVPKLSHRGITLTESVRTPLPYRYIRELREILRPAGARYFSDWTWSIQNALDGHSGGDWFEVDPSVIDQNDPDCVWRKRMTPVYRNYSNNKLRTIIGARECYELWSPVRWVLLYIKLELPLRTIQVRLLDSGEADTWYYEGGNWRLNDGFLKQGSEKRPHQFGVFRRIITPDNGQQMTGLYINTNKTADINKDKLAAGYVVPWQHEKTLYWLERLRGWQEKFNPIMAPTSWTSLEVKHFGKIKHPEILKQMGHACFLFRDASARKIGDRQKPIIQGSTDKPWYKLLSYLEERCVKRNETLQNGDKLAFVVRDRSKLAPATLYPLHSLRVSIITAYALDGGVSMAILSKCIAGHARIIMTLYYTKVGVARVTRELQEAEKRLLENEHEEFRLFLKDATYQQIEQVSAFNDSAALNAVVQSKTASSWVVEDKGICPMACGGCSTGGSLIKTEKHRDDKTIFAPVPGYPLQKNCARCRWFITGPAFLPGLVAHFNYISKELTDCSERYVRVEGQVNELEDKRATCDAKGMPFSGVEKLNSLYRHYEQEAERADKLGNDLHATIRLIKRSLEILRSVPNDVSHLQLVPAGSLQDLEFALRDVSEMHQLEVICENSVIYPETDASKAALRRSQILDAMLELNGRPPVFFKLTPHEQLLIGNELMKFIQARVGSLEGAMEIAEGLRTLRDVGLYHDAANFLDDRIGRPIPLGGASKNKSTQVFARERLE